MLPKCHTRFRFAWNWTGGETTIMSRATDETGYVAADAGAAAGGARAGTQYHFNNIRAWKVAADGTVTLAVGAA